MSIADIIAIIIILIGGISGFKKGTMKGVIQLISLASVAIVAYVLKNPIGNFIIKTLPFFQFAGFKGLFTLNILFYQGVAFIISFVLLYCILNILLDVSGLVEKLSELTIIMDIPNKVVGSILGAVESLVFVCILGFAMLQNPFTQKYVMESKFVLLTVEKTPVMGDVFKLSTECSKRIYDILDKREKDYIAVNVDMEIARTIISLSDNDQITDIMNEQVKNGKLHMNNAFFASRKVK